MKMTRDEIRILKNKHRLELVMQQTGEAFEVDSKNADLWRSTSTPGLIVNIRRQLYEIKLPGKEESGDVIAWLRRRYAWTFDQAKRFLKKRPGDPERSDPVRIAKTAKAGFAHSIEDAAKPLDRWQRQALQIAGERIREYFSWSFWNLALYIDEIRIDPTCAPEITECQRCEEPLKWQLEAEKSLSQIPLGRGYRPEEIVPLPMVAYSIKRQLKLPDRPNEDRTLEGAFMRSMDELMDASGNFFVEEYDGVVCQACAWKELKFRIGLSLCKTSASVREQAEDERKEQATTKASRTQNERPPTVITGRGENHVEP